MSEKAFRKLDAHKGIKGVSRNALMRDAVNQLIHFLSDESQNKKLDTLLNNALEEYRRRMGIPNLKISC